MDARHQWKEAILDEEEAAAPPMTPPSVTREIQMQEEEWGYFMLGPRIDSEEEWGM